MEDTKQAKQSKSLGDLQYEIIAAKDKTISVLEENAQLLRENAELREKVLKLEMRESYAVPIQNGTVKIIEEATN